MPIEDRKLLEHELKVMERELDRLLGLFDTCGKHLHRIIENRYDRIQIRVEELRTMLKRQRRPDND